MAWIVLTNAIVLAICAQILLSRHEQTGLVICAAALGLWLCAIRKDSQLLGETGPLPRFPSQTYAVPPRLKPRRRRRKLLLGISATATVINITYSWNESFEMLGVAAWVISVGAFVAAFWERRSESSPPLPGLSKGNATWRPPWFAVALLGVLLVGACFLLWRLDQIPPEMGWDHQCNLEDVQAVVEGRLRPIFFSGNNGREPGYFYWTAMLVWLTGLPIEFYVLKLSTVSVAFLMLPAVYLMTREMYGSWAGLWATLSTAVASWPVILGRLGLRCPLAPLASAWAFYFMLRGIRTGQRNSFLLLGLVLGMGLYGYSAFRVIPLAVALCWGIVWLRTRHGDPALRLSWKNLGLATIAALLVFVPLGTFMLVRPYAFWNRSLWYIAYNDIPGNPLLIFLYNLKNLALMFHWRGDGVAMNTLPYEPVLDPILGGLMILGVVIALVRTVSRPVPDHLTPGLLAAGVVALLPSALSLSFPGENPSVMRSSSAIPVVFALTGLPLGLWTEGVARVCRRHWQRILACAIAAVLVVALIWVNGHRIFELYPTTWISPGKPVNPWG